VAELPIGPAAAACRCWRSGWAVRWQAGDLLHRGAGFRTTERLPPLQSRGIGLTNYAIRVKDLSINGSTNNPGLAVTEEIITGGGAGQLAGLELHFMPPG